MKVLSVGEAWPSAQPRGEIGQRPNFRPELTQADVQRVYQQMDANAVPVGLIDRTPRLALVDAQRAAIDGDTVERLQAGLEAQAKLIARLEERLDALEIWAPADVA